MLSDPEKRKQYDRMRRFTPFEDLTARTGAGPHDSRFSFDDLGGGIGDIFSSIFDFGRGKKRQAQRGRDVEFPLEISFLTAVRGGQCGSRVHAGNFGPGSSRCSVPDNSA